MDLARVVGRIVCTVKDPSLAATKLLIVQPVDPLGVESGPRLIAIDAVGAGAGETVFFVTGREASFAFLPDIVVADASIVGIVDTVDLSDRTPPPGGRARRPTAPAPVVDPGREPDPPETVP